MDTCTVSWLLTWIPRSELVLVIHGLSFTPYSTAHMARMPRIFHGGWWSDQIISTYLRLGLFTASVSVQLRHILGVPTRLTQFPWLTAMHILHWLTIFQPIFTDEAHLIMIIIYQICGRTAEESYSGRYKWFHHQRLCLFMKKYPKESWNRQEFILYSMGFRWISSSHCFRPEKWGFRTHYWARMLLFMFF